MVESGASRLELQVHQNTELGRHRLSGASIREIETHMSIELSRPYRIPENERNRLLNRGYNY